MRDVTPNGIREQAIQVFGSYEAAEWWMTHPVMGLDGQRPIDMLGTFLSREQVSDFLYRLEYGVYT
jgi:putative toxin-antitoxin system antitoxin component (TIGR02293 family)